MLVLAAAAIAALPSTAAPGANSGVSVQAIATVRVISDAANEDLPLDFNLVLDAGQNLRRGKLALALAKSPGKIGALLELRRQTRKAAERLAQVLTKAIGDLRR